jgi:hypothetical protein
LFPGILKKALRMKGGEKRTDGRRQAGEPLGRPLFAPRAFHRQNDSLC